MNKWDERYSQHEFVYGLEPNDFLVEQSGRIPPGRVLCLAEGEGRNALHLALKGYDVLAVDSSRVGLEKAARRAQQADVTIHTELADLAEFHIKEGHWQGIVSIFAHLPPAVRKPLHQQVVAGLAPGGVFILEAYTPRQLEIGGVGGPGRDQQDRLMTLMELKDELAGLRLDVAQETDRDVNEGEFHRGRGAVVQIVGIKAST